MTDKYGEVVRDPSNEQSAHIGDGACYVTYGSANSVNVSADGGRHNGFCNEAFEASDSLEKLSSVGDCSSTKDFVASGVTERARPVIQRSLTLVETTMLRPQRVSQRIRTLSAGVHTEYDVTRRRNSRRLRFCPRGSLYDVIQDLPFRPIIGNAEEGNVAATIREESSPVPPDKSMSDETKDDDVDETPVEILVQVFVPFMLAGLGMVAAGVLLNKAKDLDAFKQIPELMVMVPPLLGLKGNLEMTLACRISTLANLGNAGSRSALLNIAAGNLALIQCQAIVAGLVAALLAVIKSFAAGGYLDWNHVLTLFTSAALTAELASIVLASVMILVIVMCQRLRMNPDNVATPVAASLGDVITLALIAGFATLLHVPLQDYQWVSGILLGLVVLLAPLWAFLAYRNSYTREVLSQGWLPVLFAIVISSGGGYILEIASTRYKGLAAYQPVINGVGGNLVAVQASRISTYLHLTAERPNLPPDESRCVGPFAVFFGSCLHARTARLLLLLLVPGQLIFVAVIDSVEGDGEAFHGPFVALYVAAAIIQVCILLYVARVLVYALWSRGTDPDNAAIPFLTALGDLLGGGLLALVYWILDLIGSSRPL
ncbi:hypothetical protein HPB51_007082 [Rhipicephalus microplus]|uniref:SLC41A/MgtE integral membrane domain-containing protein n=1 Tax=Rhipicephalus microplus TaxID=6941 RepID=A0A9J6DZR1_RHIMP|nr:solute carrier family 41 member 1-like [Rhipicephalus microplus]KAH8027532.1 hypothetical protein HPB51_007082 [Rhipicephalus microplus]